jgi:hypothetical protein
MEGLKPAQSLAKQMLDGRKIRMTYMAGWFGLEEPYNDKGAVHAAVCLRGMG